MQNPLRRIGAIGDVHAEHEELRAAIQFLIRRQPDLILCVGDIVDGNGNVDLCCEILSRANVPTVIGNHDRWLIENSNRSVPDATSAAAIGMEAMRFLTTLPATLEFPTVAGQLLLCHGLGKHDLASIRPSDTAEGIFNNLELWELYRRTELRLVINGHTHRREVRRFNQLTVISVGTLHRDEQPSCAFIDLEAGTVDFHDLRGNGEPDIRRIR